MNSNEFRKRGRAMVDYIADYMDTVGKRPVLPSVDPGYLADIMPTEAPQHPETWEQIMADVESKIMPGITHWQHPHFHAYFPSGNSYPSILGDMLSDGLGVIGFSWASSPACTELETVVLDWLGKMVGLPSKFLANGEERTGGGVIQGSASECVLVTLLAARADKIHQLTNEEDGEEAESKLLTRLVAYCSAEAHSCMQKAALVSFVKLRVLEPDSNRSLRGETLRQAMEADVEDGLIPFYVEATLGSTGCCSFDNVFEIGPVCEEYGAWLHVDGAYAGNSFICPELRGPLKGIERAQSFNLNPNKFLLTNFDCSVLWVQDKFRFTKGLVVDPLYLQHSHSEKSIDYRHWGLSLSRRFRSLKLWFVIRSYGVEGLQKYIREHCRLAKYFEKFVKQDNRFTLVAPTHLGLVCFRLRGSNLLNEELLTAINESGKIHIIPASLGDKYIIRFCVCAENASEVDMEYAWDVISNQASRMEKSIEGDLIKSISKKKSNDGDKSLGLKQKLLKKNLQRMISDPDFSNPTVDSIAYRRGSLDSHGLSPSQNFSRNGSFKNTRIYRKRSMSLCP